MNIFYLDEDPVKCAEYYNDAHVRKMIIELSQMLSTAHRVLDGEFYYRHGKNNRRIRAYQINDYRNNILYLATHENHPSCIWTRLSRSNYNYVYKLFCALCDEYSFRYGKIHATDTKLRKILNKLPDNIEDKGLTEVPLAMENEYKLDSPIEAYRNYYRKGKAHLAEWTKREIPCWFNKR